MAEEVEVRTASGVQGLFDAAAKPVKKPHEMTGLALAYMGDAVWEIIIREHLLQSGEMKPDRLHKFATKFVKAKAQSDVLHMLMPGLSEEELSIVKRGRNAKSGSSPKNGNLIDYRHATGFESLLGYLYLRGEYNRLHELSGAAINWLLDETNQPT
ncbi:ribonuclease-3 family protein [Tumebacillus sp. BK434]|uniref:Mini-ribonuclease 3 n=1 Tax=Tumebacillus sp. BK434 TaxID=2512169 RepID=UPI0010CE6518|nr:ribonuclease III domain-containing protein [Tumebacillus sp. BK434]TCP52310.1 ribonuclease-3 family protein [Tumebacillus sp. BK434]